MAQHGTEAGSKRVAENLAKFNKKYGKKRLKEDKDSGGHGSDEMSDTNRAGQIRAIGYKDPKGLKANAGNRKYND